MGQLRGTRRKRKLEELSLDEFLDGGFALAGGGGAQPEGAERATRASPPAGSEAVQHRAQLDALRERDPDFYAYLQQTDAELLRFGEGGEGSGGGSDGAAPGSASDEQPPVAAPVAGDGSKPAPAEPARDATEGKGGGVVTAALIDRWCQDARATCSYRAMRNLLRAYRFACHYGESEEDVDAALRITSVAAMDRLVKFMLDEADGILRGMLGLDRDAQLRSSDVTGSARWPRVELLARAYLGNTLHLLGALTEGGALAHVLRRLRPSAPLLACSERLQRKFLRRALAVFLDGAPAARVHAFLFVRATALALPPPALGAALKGVTRAFMAGARFVSAGSAPHIAFMGACVIELHGLDPAAAYEHAFLAVRGLAGVLRGALSNKTKDAFRSVYCWQTVAALELWARLLAAHAGAGPLAPLAFPVAQLLTGAARLVPSARYLPLRLRLLRALVRLGAAMRLAVPAAPALLDLLAWPALLKSARPAPAAAGGPAAARPPGLLLRASRAALAAPAFQADVVEQALELLAGHLAAWACAPGFPELAHVPLLRLRRFAAGTPVERFRAGARGLIAALEANAAWAAAARGAAGFAPGDAAAVAGFLAAEDAAGAAPLQKYAALLAERARARRDLLAAERMGDLDESAAAAPAKRTRVGRLEEGDASAGEERDGLPYELSDDDSD